MLVLGVLLLPLACGGNKTTGPTANLVITFEPNPVTFSANSQWNYWVFVTETTGIGVDIFRFDVQGYSPSGEGTGLTEHPRADFELWFRECGGEGNYIAGGTTRCTPVTSRGFSNAGHRDWTFFGVDDLGNTVKGTGRIDLL